MNDQEPQNQNKTTEEAGVEKRRRFIKGAGIATPVVLTLSSPSVFGALCASEIASGNESHTGAGSCVEGFSPGAWVNPGGNVGSDSTIDAWTKAGFEYGTLPLPDSNKKFINNKPENYSGGTLFSDPKAFGDGDSRPMREILCDKREKGSVKWHLVAAMLNASYFKNTYVLTPSQVIGLWKGTFTLPPPYTNINDFLDSTWI